MMSCELLVCYLLRGHERWVGLSRTLTSHPVPGHQYEEINLQKTSSDSTCEDVGKGSFIALQ